MSVADLSDEKIMQANGVAEICRRTVPVLDRPSISREWLRARMMLVASTALFLAWIIPPMDYDNTRSRYFLAASIAERATFNIDPYADQTIDLSQNGNHFYSNKAIGAPIFGAALWCGLRRFTLRDRLDLDPELLYWVRVLTTSVPTALFTVLFADAALLLGASPAGALALTLAYLLGTPAILHGSTFSGHQLAAICSFAGFAFAVSGLRRNRRPFFMLTSSGFLVGWGVLSDYIAMTIAIAIAIYVLVECGLSRKRLTFAFMAGAAVPAGILLFYNLACFGDPFSLSYAHQTTKAFAQASRHGLLGIALPAPKALFMLLVSPSRGLLILSPFLLLSCLGLCRLLQSLVWRKEAIVLAAAILGTLLVNAGFYGWDGGWTYGPRYLTAGVPFLAIAAAPVLSRYRILFSGLAIISIALYLPAAIGCQYVPRFFVNPLIEVVLPLFCKGYWVNTPLGWREGATPWALLLLPVFLVPNLFFVVILARKGATATFSQGVSCKLQLGILASVLVAVMLVFGLFRTPSDAVAVAESHRDLGKLLFDPWRMRPDLLPRAEEQLAQGNLVLPSNQLRSSLGVDLASSWFTTLACESGWFRRIGRPEQSRRAANRALTVFEQWLERSTASERGFVFLRAATTLALAGRADLALQQLSQVPAMPSDNPTLLMTRAVDRLQQGHTADALTTARQLVTCCPDSKELVLFVNECAKSVEKVEDLTALRGLVDEAANGRQTPERLRVVSRIIDIRLARRRNG
jgi:hypothetical protein